jgi:ornithine cyclodeaminase/alanine dehydrogenase-like protein (mu-crystallin family)
MTLIINNKEVAQLLTMGMTIDALEAAYAQLVRGESVCRPRIDIDIPTRDPSRLYRWGTMEGGSTQGYFAIRMKSDIVYEQEYNGARTREKYCMRPGLYCGLILLTDVQTGEPLAFLNDGVLQKMRVGADSGIGVKYMAREDAATVGMLGSGGMARTHMAAFMHVRPGIKRLQVYSPTPANREAFGREMAQLYGIEVKVLDRPEEVYRGADIVAGVTDSSVPVIDGALIEKGTHVVNIGGGGRPDEATIARIDAYLRFGNATSPEGHDGPPVEDEHFTYAAHPGSGGGKKGKKGKRAQGAIAAANTMTFEDIVNGRRSGRSSPEQISYSERGNLQGNQFWAVAGKVYELAKQQGLGREIPTEWFLQDIRN